MSQLRAAADAETERERQDQVLTQQQEARDRQVLAIATVDIKRRALATAADSAAMETAALMEALVDVATRQASQLDALAKETMAAAELEQQRHRRVMWWTRLGVVLAAIAAVASVVAIFL